MRRKIFLTLAILWMAGIFLFSARNAELSTEDSHHTSDVIGELFIQGYREWKPARKNAFREQMDHAVRKSAHFLEYALLGMLWLGYFLPGLHQMKAIAPYRSSWLIATAYAATDEFHQLFVPGRAGRILDIGIDSAGAATGLLGALILCLLLHFILQRKNKGRISP